MPVQVTQMSMWGNLREVRRASGLSIQEVSDGMGYKHRKAVTTLEGQKEWTLSSVAKYVAACGGKATLTVEISGEVIEFDMAVPVDSGSETA